MCDITEKQVVYIGRKKKRLDTCLIPLIQAINLSSTYETVASCCGHGIFHATIFIKKKGALPTFWEFFTRSIITPLKTRYLTFYQKDTATGLYFNPIIENYYYHR